MHREDLTGLVLAGGQGSRMDGQDKGLISYEGHPLAMHALKALGTVADSLLISANRSLDGYEALGYPVVTDEDADFQGPLSGVIAGMKVARTPFLMVLPCDMPKVTQSVLEAILIAHQDNPDIPLFVAHDGERIQPLLMLVRTDLMESLRFFLRAGGRKVLGWVEQHPHIKVDLSLWRSCLVNINRPEDLTR